jgi:hypothetical protein
VTLCTTSIGVFDAFEDDAGRKAHLNGPIAAALMSKATALLSEPPKIEQVDLLAASYRSDRQRLEGLTACVARRCWYARSTTLGQAARW